MREIFDKIDGDLFIEEDTRLLGMVTGSVTVIAPNHFVLQGMVCRDLIAQQGTTVDVHGTVVGAVVNHGADIEIAGVIGSLQENKGASAARIIDGAVIKTRHTL